MDKLERRKRILLFITFLSSCLSISLLSAALGTDYWIVSRLKDINSETAPAFQLESPNGPPVVGDNETIRMAMQILSKNRPGGLINFGLFHGFVRHNKGLGDRQAELKTVCEDSFCFHYLVMDVENVNYAHNAFHNFTLDLSYADLPYNELCMGDGKSTEPAKLFQYIHLFNFGLWATTIFFVSISILFGIVGAMYSLLNTTYTPVAVINGVAGLFMWNTLGITSTLLGMMMWVILFYTHFQYNVLPAELLYPVPKFSTCELAELGYSFWLCLIAMLLFAFNIILLTLKDIDLRRTSVKQVPPSADNMFMY